MWQLLTPDLRTQSTEDTFGRVEREEGLSRGSGRRLPTPPREREAWLPTLHRLLGGGLLPACAVPVLREQRAGMVRERGQGNGIRNHRRAQPESSSPQRRPRRPRRGFPHNE